MRTKIYEYNAVDALTKTGIVYNDAVSLRRIAMTLHRWHELECGDSNDYASWGIVRGRKVRDSKERGAWHFEYIEDGKPYIERHIHTVGYVEGNHPRYESIADRETGALKRLNAIMRRYPHLSAYIQTDPRGAPLYILRPGDVPAGKDANDHYNNGIVVCK